jgi:hypothetical protein
MVYFITIILAAEIKIAHAKPSATRLRRSLGRRYDNLDLHQYILISMVMGVRMAWIRKGRCRYATIENEIVPRLVL